MMSGRKTRSKLLISVNQVGCSVSTHSFDLIMGINQAETELILK